MPLQNIIGLVVPLGVAIAIGSILIGLFYRDRNEENYHQTEDEFNSTFDPGCGYDTTTTERKSRRRDEEEEKCIICYDSIKRFQSLRVLPCAHQFHRRCINGWLRYEQFCPLCKTAVVS